jgi:hypothetical protein
MRTGIRVGGACRLGNDDKDEATAGAAAGEISPVSFLDFDGDSMIFSV